MKRVATQYLNGRLTGRQSAGFSLIELMLALALGLVVTWGIVQLFVGNTQTYATLNGQSRLQENARYALDFIARSARSSGYFGCAPNVFDTTLNGNLDQTFEFNIENPIEAFAYVGVDDTPEESDWTPSATALPREVGAATQNAFVDGTGIDFTTVIGSDILVFRRVESMELIADEVPPLADPVVEDDGDVDFAVDDFLVISDCKHATLFRVTGRAAAAGQVTLSRASGAGLYANSADTTLDHHYGDVLGIQGANVGRIVTDIFFVAEGAGTNNRGDKPSSLWRRSGTNAPVELVEGVSDISVLFGVDTDPTDVADAPNTYIALDAVDFDTQAVRTMRIQVTVNSVDALTAGDANPVNRTFSQTINLRNG